jgi:hypothetical protein
MGEISIPSETEVSLYTEVTINTVVFDFILYLASSDKKCK